MKYKLGIVSLVVATLLFSGCEDKNNNIEKINDTENTENYLQNNNIVIDDADIFKNDVIIMKMYIDYNKQLLKDFDIDFRVITTNSDENINIFANKAFSKLKKENRSKSGKTLILVVNPSQDKVRMEVSMALEPVYTDAYVSYVERKGMIPYLRNNKIADGIYMMTELARDRAYEATIGKEFMAPMENKSIGGGAKTKAHIGIIDTNAKKGKNIHLEYNKNPKEVLKIYISEVLKKHNKNPNLDIYTDDTKDFWKKWTVTEINQDHEIHNLAPCTDKMTVLYDDNNTHAVLAIKPYQDNRTCSPYFFKKEEGKWKLDFSSMSKIIRFNQKMQFHLDKENRLKDEGIYYAFAFDGIGLDKNGYPFKTKYPKPDKIRWGYTCNGWYLPEDHNKMKTPEAPQYTKCWIKYVYNGSPADIRLGLDVYDSVIGIGEGDEYKENISLDTFMDYLSNLHSGEKATVIVKDKNGNRIIRQGIAP